MTDESIEWTSPAVVNNDDEISTNSDIDRFLLDSCNNDESIIASQKMNCIAPGEINATVKAARYQRIIFLVGLISIIVAVIVPLAIIIKNQTNNEHSVSSTSAISQEETKTSSDSSTPGTMASLINLSQHSLKPGRRSSSPSFYNNITSNVPSPFPKTNLPTTHLPTLSPTFILTSLSPTTSNPTNFPTENAQVTTFLGIGDVPYDEEQESILRRQLDEVDYNGVDFLIHVGDLRGNDGECRRRQYETAANLLYRSRIPVFVIPGDNDWSNCPNINEGWELYTEHFVDFDRQYWNHTFQIQKLQGRPETFSFINKGTLFIGLNIVGDEPIGREQRKEWEQRLYDQYEWTRYLILEYLDNLPRNRRVGRVVIFAHARPTGYHRVFFNNLSEFIQNELEDSVPILYLNGDSHFWAFDPRFLGHSSLQRITVSGLGREPPTLFRVYADGTWQDPGEAFQYDRNPRIRDDSNSRSWNDDSYDDAN